MGEAIVVLIIALGTLFFIPYAILRIENKSSHQGVFQNHTIPKCLNTAFFFPQSKQNQNHSVFGLVTVGITWIFFIVLIAYLLYVGFNGTKEVYYTGAILALVAMTYSAVIHLFEMAFTWIQEMYRCKKVGDE